MLSIKLLLIIHQCLIFVKKCNISNQLFVFLQKIKKEGNDIKN